MVLFAGIAAEALVYGEAEGGENDENLFMGICILLQPPLSVAEVSLNFYLVGWSAIDNIPIFVLWQSLPWLDVKSSKMVSSSILQSAQVA